MIGSGVIDVVLISYHRSIKYEAGLSDIRS
jgi:hypothetical protein